MLAVPDTSIAGGFSWLTAKLKEIKNNDRTIKDFNVFILKEIKLKKINLRFIPNNNLVKNYKGL